LAAQTLVLVLVEYRFFQTSLMSSGCVMSRLRGAYLKGLLELVV